MRSLHLKTWKLRLVQMSNILITFILTLRWITLGLSLLVSDICVALGSSMKLSSYFFIKSSNRNALWYKNFFWKNMLLLDIRDITLNCMRQCHSEKPMLGGRLFKIFLDPIATNPRILHVTFLTIAKEDVTVSNWVDIRTIRQFSTEKLCRNL